MKLITACCEPILLTKHFVFDTRPDLITEWCRHLVNVSKTNHMFGSKSNESFKCLRNKRCILIWHLYVPTYCIKSDSQTHAYSQLHLTYYITYCTGLHFYLTETGYFYWPVDKVEICNVIANTAPSLYILCNTHHSG